MTEKSQGIEKICPACGKGFQCNAADIDKCQCSALELKEATLAALSRDYGDCLCADCLLRLSRLYGNKDNSGS